MLCKALGALNVGVNYCLYQTQRKAIFQIPLKFAALSAFSDMALNLKKSNLDAVLYAAPSVNLVSPTFGFMPDNSKMVTFNHKMLTVFATFLLTLKGAKKLLS